MSRHTFTLAGALAGCLMFAGAAQPTEVQPLPSAKPQASPLIILAQQAEQPGVPRGAKCLKWGNGHTKRKCTQWCYPSQYMAC